jgi:hypothetical protein
LLNLSFAVRVSEPVTLIFVPPVEMPAPWHVRLGETTLKPCESFAVCGTRLSLPYVLQSTSLLRQHEKSTQHAKVALDRMTITMRSARFWRDSGLSFEGAAVGSWIAVGAAEEVVAT